MRSSELNAVLGLSQLPRLDRNIKLRCDNLKTWLNNLDDNLYITKYIHEGSSNFALPLLVKKDIMSQVCEILEEEQVEYRLGTAGGGNQARQPYLEKFSFKTIGKLKNSNYIHDYGLYIGNHTELTEQQIINLCKRLNNV